MGNRCWSQNPPQRSYRQILTSSSVICRELLKNVTNITFCHFNQKLYMFVCSWWKSYLHFTYFTTLNRCYWYKTSYCRSSRLLWTFSPCFVVIWNPMSWRNLDIRLTRRIQLNEVRYPWTSIWTVGIWYRIQSVDSVESKTALHGKEVIAQSSVWTGKW